MISDNHKNQKTIRQFARDAQDFATDGKLYYLNLRDGELSTSGTPGPDTIGSTEFYETEPHRTSREVLKEIISEELYNSLFKQS